MDQLCPKCKTMTRISASRYVIRDGKLFIIQEMTCRNPKCLNDGVVVKTVETELPVETE